MADGCVIIGQHADSTAPPAAAQAAQDSGTVAYSVGYNIDMLSVAPTAALTSATNDWGVYYTYAFNCALNGEEISTDWCEGYETGAVGITELGESCAEGTADKVAEVEAALKSGELQVFDTSTFTVNGEHPTSILVDMDGDFEGRHRGRRGRRVYGVLPALRSRLHRPDRRHHRAEQLRPALRYPPGENRAAQTDSLPEREALGGFPFPGFLPVPRRPRKNPSHREKTCFPSLAL